MKVTWNNKNKKKRPLGALSAYPGLPFDDEPDSNATAGQQQTSPDNSDGHDHFPDAKRLADSFQAQGTKLAEEGNYREALGKWENALTITPENGVLHEQKAQVLLELGDAWSALKAATRATELEPSWAEAWVTLGRAQLNFGEPDSAVESFDKALAIKPDSEEAEADRRTASRLVRRRKELHSSGLSSSTIRYMVGDKSETS